MSRSIERGALRAMKTEGNNGTIGPLAGVEPIV